MGNRDIVWKKGESLARQYLEEKGYEIIGQNYRTRYSEIDLIVKKDKILIFVEVRAKSNELFGTPEETLNYKKLKKLLFNAENYVKLHHWPGPYQIDAICVVLGDNNSVKRIEHYEKIL